MDAQRSTLVVSIHNCQFQKDFQYFITVQFEGEGEKLRTDISENVSNPVFSANVFMMPLTNYKIDINQRLIFQAFILADRGGGAGGQGGKQKVVDLESKGQPKLLGEAVLELGPLTPALTEISGTGIRQNLKFVRIQDGKSINVGQFVVNLKLVSEQTFGGINNQLDSQNMQSKILERQEIQHPLPQVDFNEDFFWRLRVDVRSAVDLQLNRQTPSGLPHPFIEVGWSLYDQQVPDEQTLYITNVVENNRHPIWNQQFIIQNPQTVEQLEGFLYIGVKDKMAMESLDTIYLPIQSLTPFVPYNFEFFSQKQEYEARGKLYVSVCLEAGNTESFQDNLVDVVTYMIHFDPFPTTNRFFLLMTLFGHKPVKVPFVSVDLKNPTNLAKIVQENSNPKTSTFISTIMKVPPAQIDTLYSAVCIFTLPKSLLNKQVTFFIAGKDEKIADFHGMPNGVVGHTDLVDETLKKLFYTKSEDSNAALVPFTWDKSSSLYPVFSNSRCNIELTAISHEDVKKQIQQSGVDQFKNSKSYSMSGSQKGGGFKTSQQQQYNQFDTQGGKMSQISAGGGYKNEKDRWQVLSRELAQKQEIIHRMIKEIDDKTESLKITGSEIVDLRRHIKMLQSENAILRKKLAHEEQIEISAIVTKEISKMSNEELKAKIIKIAQAYRDERVRNEEFDKALKGAQQDIAQSRQLQAELESYQKQHQANSQKLIKMQQEIQKVSLYKETIKKQEKVIAKLEKLMETSLKDTSKARNAILENEQLKTDIVNLQSQIKQMTYGPDNEFSELERYKNECQKLEKIVFELQEELKSKRPVTSYGDDIEREKMELEVKLSKSNARVEALQYEMTENAKNFAKEIATLKMIIAEKQALLDTLSMNNY